MKTCSRCKTTYEDVEKNFVKCKQSKDGRHYYCNSCRTKERKEHYLFKNPRPPHVCVDCGISLEGRYISTIRCVDCKKEKERQRNRERYKNDPRVKENKKKWNIKNRKKYLASKKRYYKKKKKEALGIIEPRKRKGIDYWNRELERVWRDIQRRNK